MTLRKTIFWLHLAAGVVAGVVIGLLSITGVALTFEKELIAWSERAVQRVVVPAGATPLSPDEILARVRAARPEASVTSLVLKNDPGAAAAVSFGRTGTVYVDPYTGEIRTPVPTATRSFMTSMTNLHRWLALAGEQRGLGKAITGAANVAFLILGLTGLYLWWPRSWSARAVKAVTKLRLDLHGKARDFNWHNALGFWFALPIIVVTATALPISYGWAGTLLAKLNPPGTAAGGPGAPAGPAVVVPSPSLGAAPRPYADLFKAVQTQMPTWSQITLNLGEANASRPAGGTAPTAAGAASSGPRAVAFAVRDAASWPRTATTNLSLDPFTGQILRSTGFSDQPLGSQIRGWTRFLHTGEALGIVGQLVAGLASLAGIVLMWTGFALTWRRFFGRRTPAPVAA